MELQKLLAQHGPDIKKRSCPLRGAPWYFKIRKLPDHQDLFFVHSTRRSDGSIKEVVQANGAVFSSGLSRLVSLGMPKVERLGGLPPALEAGQSMQVAEDGTVINVFKIEDKLLCTTAHRPDARKARWASEKTFWQLLEESVPEGEAALLDAIKPGRTYSFVLKHPENIIVLPHAVPAAVHVATRRMDTFEECSEPLPDWAVKPSWVSRDEGEAMTHCNPAGARGLLLVDATDPTTVRRSIFDFPAYRVAADLRKNKKHLHLSYLACTEDERALCRSVFPPACPLFDLLDLCLADLTCHIHQLYLCVYVRKTVPLVEGHPFTCLLRACHRSYLRHRNPMKLGDVGQVVRGADWRNLDAALQHLTASPRN